MKRVFMIDELINKLWALYHNKSYLGYYESDFDKLISYMENLSDNPTDNDIKKIIDYIDSRHIDYSYKENYLPNIEN